jgi:hypothetical protein
LFWWSLGVIDAWKGGHKEYERQYEYGCGLFHAAGAVLVWMPLAVISSVATYIALFLFLFLFPIEIKGFWQYLGFLAALGGGFALFQGLRYFIGGWSEEPDRVYWRRHFPNVFVLARKYISARIEQTNPLITFVGSKKK